MPRSAQCYLVSLGVAYTKGTSVAPDTRLLVVGADGQVSADQVRALRQAGGHAIFLARQDSAGPLGSTLEKVSGFHGSLNAPTWPEARGLSASDLRWRTDGDAWVVKDTPMGTGTLQVGQTACWAESRSARAAAQRSSARSTRQL